MIDAALNWFFRWTAKSQLKEADQLEAEAEAMQRRAARLRYEASLYDRVGQPPQRP